MRAFRLRKPRRAPKGPAACTSALTPPCRACARYPGCSRMFKLPGALHTHTGWHKRKENIDAGLYDGLGHHLKVRRQSSSPPPSPLPADHITGCPRPTGG